MGQGSNAGRIETLPADLVCAAAVPRKAGNVFPTNWKYQLSLDDCSQLSTASAFAGSLQSAFLPSDDPRSAAPFLFFDFSCALLWNGDLVSGSKTRPAITASAAGDGLGNRPCFFKRSRSV